MQGTVANFREDTSGEVVLDSGRRVPFDAAAFAESGLRFLRPGQRVTLDADPSGRVVAIRIVTMHK
ncbi:cold-shock protein [Glycomyces buryatensis]|uniref:Cold-shock protein n=1 Tax=Glycomyces buryatensis TaxID=2570927 RepID=A0A4S8QAC3_9ACTN|nr:cold-shock protein [Glycomyces buryatensis]THV39792.1 cold-shock protein [Glycomyces buryatensis]